MPGRRSHLNKTLTRLGTDPGQREDTWLTVPELGLDHHHVSRNHLLISPPALPVHGEQEEAEGTVPTSRFALFRSSRRADGSFGVYFKTAWHHFFAIDQRIEACAGS